MPTPDDAGSESSGGGSPTARWLVSAAAAFLHASVLTVAASRSGSPVVFYGVLAAPVFLAALLHPADTLRRSYRWLAVYLIALTSIASLPALLVGEVWLIRRTWVENAGRPVPLVRALLRIPGTLRDRHTRAAHD